MSKNAASSEEAPSLCKRQKSDLTVGQDLRELVSALGTLIGKNLAANIPIRSGDKNNIATRDESA